MGRLAGKIKVEIKEDYPGCQHFHLRIRLPGMGLDHPGFKLVRADEEDFHGSFPLFRPEYAKEIKERLERTLTEEETGT